MRRDQEQIKKYMSEFLDSLIEVAMADNRITEEEQAIIDNIRDGITELESQLMQILEDDLSDEEFEDLYTQIMQDIIYNATQVAKKDDVITDDESKLLLKLEEFSQRGIIDE